MNSVCSVVIKCLNGADTIAAALESLLAQQTRQDWEIVLADNGSTDATREIFLAHARDPRAPAMRIVDCSGRRGRSHALNLGIRGARGDRLMFLDADDTVAPGWLDAMADALAQHDFVAARMDVETLNPGGQDGRRKLRQARELARLSQAPHCLHAGGATLGFHRAVFEAVGGFDLDVTCLEDTDFCIRAHLAGFELRFVPDAVYNYRFRSEPGAIYRQARDYSKARALLRRRYAPEASRRLAPMAWIGLTMALSQLGASELRRRAGRRQRSQTGAALYERRLGLAMGDLQGALAYGVAPPQSRSETVAPALRRPWQAVKRRVMSALFGSTVAVRTREKLMALTFDDGPDPQSTPLLLDALARVGAKATFFVIGTRAASHPELVARIAAEGHEIGNHTWDHPSLPTLSRGRVVEQLQRARELLAPLGSKLMRPPYGDQTPRTYRTARGLGYCVVLWSISSGDWRGESADIVSQRIIDKASPGAIVLMHDSLSSFEDESFRDRGPTIEAAVRVVEALPDYRFVTVSELLTHGAAVRQARFKATAQDQLEALGQGDGIESTARLT